MVCEDLEGWYVVECPAHVQFSSVRKECGTHGKIYAIWDCEEQTPCWVSQSIPKVVEAINTRVFGTSDKRLHASSIYRVLRGESMKRLHKSHRVVRFHRTDLDDFNRLLTRFPKYFFVTKTPDFWRIKLDETSSSREPPGYAAEARKALDGRSIGEGPDGPGYDGPDEGPDGGSVEPGGGSFGGVGPVVENDGPEARAAPASPQAEPDARDRGPGSEAPASAKELPEDGATLSRFGELPPHTDHTEATPFP